jgi:hypothetical protein
MNMDALSGKLIPQFGEKLLQRRSIVRHGGGWMERKGMRAIVRNSAAMSHEAVQMQK